MENKEAAGRRPEHKEMEAGQTVEVRGKLPSDWREACARLGIEWRLDALAGKVLVRDRWAKPSLFKVAPEAEIEALWLRFREHVTVKSIDPKRSAGLWVISKELFRQHGGGTAALQRVNPFEDYIRGCERSAEPDAPNPEDLLPGVYGVANTPLNRELGDLLLRAMITRGLLLYPGQIEAKFDYMPVLISGQGTGKSTALSALFPQHLARSLVSENAQLLADDDYAFGRSIRGRILGIVDEMPTTWKLSRRMKARITRREDPIRDLWSRDEMDWPRTCVLIATANDEGRGVLPVDASGHRRYPVVHVPDDAMLADGLGFLRRWRDHLWAVAYERVRADRGAPLVLSADSASAAEALATEAEYAPDREAVDALVAAVQDGNVLRSATFAELKQTLRDADAMPERTDNASLARVFRQAGYAAPKRRGGRWSRSAT